MSNKKLLINQVKVASLQDRATIPTKIRYEGKNFKIGHDVRAERSSDDRVIGNFKVELGRQTREQLISKKARVSKGHTRTALGIAKDFLTALCDEINSDVERYGRQMPKKVLVAEPISIEEEGKVSGQWLANYRYAIKAALQGRFEEVDFLPEPFAVFQYYRYGLRHPLLSEHASHIALVLDFGGGTFDVSVIESTKSGDISQSGRASRPLAAKSIPVGGFFINQKIAEHLLFETLPGKPEKTAARKVLKSIGEASSWLTLNSEDHPPEQANFIKHFQSLLDEVETAKVNICGSIRNWELTEDIPLQVRQIVEVPRSPFSDSGDFVGISLSASEIKTVFQRDVWSSRLKEAVFKAIERAKQEVQGKPISVVLLSGGSTNIGWTKTLIERDLVNALGGASILEISENYQEVVAKGLAVECARQFYTEGDGDFGAVTYNRLNLVLSNDSATAKVYPFKPRTKGLPKPEGDGILLPSAASLRAYQDEVLSWKVNLDSSPRHCLEYFYLKSSFDPNDLENLHNATATRVFLKDRIFGQSIDVELKVNADGSAFPTFLLNRGKGERERRVSGDPFYLDMTYAGGNEAQDSYLGLDFGTATSAASIVFENDIKAYEDRSKQKSWLELSDLIETLPYPASHPLAVYVAQTNKNLLESAWKTAVESILTLFAYIGYSDICSTLGRKPFELPANFNRSAGPLLQLISRFSEVDLSKTKYASSFHRAITQDIDAEISEISAGINDIKHDRIPKVDFNHTLGLLGNSLKKSLDGSHFGTFEAMRRKSFGSGYEGVYRCFLGANPPFIVLNTYSGANDFGPANVFISDLDTGSILDLSPFYYSFPDSGVPIEGDCPIHFLDSVKGSFEDYRYIPVKKGRGIDLEQQAALKDLREFVSACLKGEENCTLIAEGKFSERER
ncbi:hypothetical protein Q4539_00085 [Yoonia sp. 1_MG-2023]|nr:hypothetical protein [Yoonia sp. 1_MG-2023]